MVYFEALYAEKHCHSVSPVSALRAHVRRFLCHTGQEGSPSQTFCKKKGWKKASCQQRLVSVMLTWAVMAEPFNSAAHSSFDLLSDGEASCILHSTAHSVNDRGAGFNSADRWALIWNTRPFLKWREVTVLCNLSDSIVNSLLLLQVLAY